MTGIVLEERYELGSLIGTGGMAEVYRAHDRIEDRTVAIKMIKREYCEDSQYMRRFERETQAMLTLECPNIVRAYSYGTYEGRSYIVMEYVEGLTLKEYLKAKGKLSQKAAVHIVCRVLNALDCAHKGGYVHRDVKPQNVLISKDKTIKLTDFGIAKDTASITRTFDGNSVVGSVQYISPEQASGGTVGAESDLYSVGIMLYEMLIGEPPFEGDNSVQIALKHINEPLTPPMEKDPTISPALSDVIVKATAKQLSVRYSSAEEMKSDLIRALREPENRFAYVEDPVGKENRKKDKPEGGSGTKLWHIILPVALMVALVVGMFFIWYFSIYGNRGKDTLVKVPNVLEKTLAEATELLRNREFEVRFAGTVADSEYPRGTVCKQSPAGGKKYEKGTEVEIWLSSGSETVSMQSLTGMTLDEAEPILESLNIRIRAISYEQSDAEDGTIIHQSIPEGTEIVPDEENDPISLVISGVQGVTLVPMPDLSRVTTVGGINQILDVYGVANRRFRFSMETKGGSGAYGSQLVSSQTPAPGIPFLPSETKVEIWLYAEYGRLCSSDVSFELPINRDGTSVEVVLEAPFGNFLIYEDVLDSSGSALIEFTAGFMYEGEYDCVVYRNGSEAMRFSTIFTKRK